MKIFPKTLLRDERAAITVDWTALTAGILILGIAVVYAVFREGVTPLSDEISANLVQVEVTGGDLIGDPPDALK